MTYIYKLLQFATLIFLPTSFCWSYGKY